MLGGDSSGRPPADLWPFYKELLATVEAAVVLKQPGIRYYYFLIPWTATTDPKHFETCRSNILHTGRFLTDANM